jgi:hypothetical protein
VNSRRWSTIISPLISLPIVQLHKIREMVTKHAHAWCPVGGDMEPVERERREPLFGSYRITLQVSEKSGSY